VTTSKEVWAEAVMLVMWLISKKVRQKVLLETEHWH